MPASVIIASSYDPGYLAIYEHLVHSRREAGADVVVLDISPVLATPVDSYHRWVLRLFGIPFPGHDLRARIESLGARYLPVTDAAETGSDQLGAELEEKLAIAVQSALITFFRTDRPDSSKRSVRRLAQALEREGRVVYRSVRSLLASTEVSVGYVPNGRFPHQKLAMLAFHDGGVRTRHFEKGEAPGRAYVQNYAPQDRLESQGAVDQVLAGLTPAEVELTADTWMARRVPSAESRNEFAALWSDGLPAEVEELRRSGRKLVGFFTSSQDEFQFLGPEWQLHDWADQSEAFDRILREFEVQGWAAYLRVHPNLATKEEGCFRRERDSILKLAAAHPSLVVIWHDDPANSYILTDASDAVVVWDSTVGLEASARGIPTWTAATSRYGLVADIHEVLSVEDVERDGIITWQVDRAGAKRFIAYLVMRDEDITEGAPWMSWIRPTFGVRLAALASAGGAPSIRSAVRSQIDVYLHRDRRANARARAVRRR